MEVVELYKRSIGGTMGVRHGDGRACEGGTGGTVGQGGTVEVGQWVGQWDRSLVPPLPPFPFPACG